jgi:hypothetical protein
MRKIFLLIFIVIVVNLPAQEMSPWSNIRHSSYTIDNNLHIRSELVPLPDSYTEFFYSQGSGWMNQNLVNITGTTYEAVVPVNPDETIICRYRSVIQEDLDWLEDLFPDLPDSLIVMMPGYLPADDFPPPASEMAHVGDDSVGEIPGDMPEYLDITAQYFSYSETRFYTGISNNDTGFPTGPLTGPFNIYASLIINPETAVTDTVLYALIYAQIPVVLNPGLYRFSGLDFDGIQRIGDIEHHISGNNLTMACSINELTSDPYFGEWPNMSNSLSFVPITMRITLAMEVDLVDVGQLSQMIFEQYIIEPFTNSLPELSEVEIDVLTNLTTISLTYYDLDGNFPLVSEVIIDDTQTYQFFPQSLDFTMPVNYIATFTGEWTAGQIRFSDNAYEMVTHPIVLTAEDELLPAIAEPVITLFPNPFNPAKGDNRLSISVDSPGGNDESLLEIFDIRGRLVYRTITVTSQQEEANVYWDGQTIQGSKAGSGVYLIRYTDRTANRKAASKVLIVK